MKLSKPWVWRENAVIYTHPSQVIHEPYPFYWYRATGLQIELIKQVSKFCGIVQDWNEYIKPEPIPLEAVEAPVLSIQDMYIDRRSWLTLGEVPYDPIDQIENYTWGNKRVQLSFTPDGQLFERKEWVNDQIVYTAQFRYRKAMNYSACSYRNSLGVVVIKDSLGWRWDSGKPLIEKKYGKR